MLWVSSVQYKRFGNVYTAIEKRKKHCVKMQLGLEIDDCGILRCHGRYLNSNLPEEMKYPKLLPRREHFLQVVIQEVHRHLIHAGVSHTLSQIGQEYWVVQGRAEVKKMISHCLICKRHSGPLAQYATMA